MNIFCTGASGKIGQRLLKMGVTPLECDVTDFDSVDRAISEAKPEVICHLASLSDVDFCERPENKEMVIKTNLRGTWNVAESAREHVCGVALISSDHVFDGKHGPYKETDHPKDPVNFYGMSKMAAEALQTDFANLKIVRTSYLFNRKRLNLDGLLPPDGFPTFMKRSFMYEGHFAINLFSYLLRFDMMPDILHISGSETISWYEFALATASIFDIDKSSIIPRKRELKGLPPRPKKAGLDTRLSSKFLRQFSYLDGLKTIKDEQE